MSMTHKYIPRIPQREENLFLEEYYSGTDTKVYLNNNEQTEISYISYSLNEQLKPIYGYASRTFDDMAVGNRIVTGVLRMPIKNPEEQTPYEVVVEHSTIEEINAKNALEQAKKNSVEWVNNGINTFINNNMNNSTNGKIYEYYNKLKRLGYVSSNIGDNIKNFIKKFQVDNKLFTSGELNNDTMAAIDSKLEMQGKTKGLAKEKIDVYIGPTSVSGVVYTLQPNEEFYIIHKMTDFTLIRTMDGKDGYAKTAVITEVQ